MSGGIDRQIFDDGGRPEEASDGGTDLSTFDHAVDDAIRDLGRGELPTAPAQPRERPQQPQPQHPGLEGVDDRSNSGLLRALLDERDRRQELKQQVDRYEAEKRERAAREQKPAISERLFQDPDGTLSDLKAEWTGPLEQRIAQLQVNQDFAFAEARHGDTFRNAWAAWYETVRDGKDAATYFHIMNSGSPGEAMVQWFRQSSVVSTVGDDLDAYNERVIQNYLTGQGLATSPPRGPNGQFQPRPQAQRMPTSISRMGSSGNPSQDDDDTNDGTDAAIFAAARPKHRRQR